MDDNSGSAVEWRAGHDRVCALVERVAADAPDRLERRVPATPDWTARELLCHVVGLGADVLRGDEPADHRPAWTQGHLEARAGHAVQQLLAEWRELADDLETYVRETDPRPLGDLLIHEQDLRGALEAPGARSTPGLALVRGTMAQRLGEDVADRDLPPLRLEADGSLDDDWSWQSADGDPGVVVTGSGFDLFRAVTSRRTADQLRAMVRDGDIGPYLTSFAVLGDLPDTPLPERGAP